MRKLKELFGNNVKKYRKMMNWSQAELAEKIDISVPFMAYIEEGKRGVSMETIEALAITFKIPYSALFEDFSENPILSDKQKIHTLKKQIINAVTKTIDKFLEE